MGANRRAGLFVGCVMFFGLGCSEGGPASVQRPEPDFQTPDAISFGDFGGNATVTSVRLATSDDREPVLSDRPLPPISGGTLAVDSEAGFAVAADPDRDRVSVVSLGDVPEVTHVQLDAGSEPGRVVIDGQGRAHVALRGTGQVVSIDLVTAALGSARVVCKEIRGLAVAEERSSLFAACAEGELVELPLVAGDAVARHHLDIDLRDVSVVDGGLQVSRFKTAELLQVSFSGEITSRNALDDVVTDINFDGETGVPVPVESQPHAAWRMQRGADGRTYMLHGLASRRLIEVSTGEEVDGSEIPAYGGGSGCGGVGSNAVTVFDAEGATTYPTAVSGLTVDLAHDANSGSVALARAGAPDPGAPVSLASLGLPPDIVEGTTDEELLDLVQSLGLDRQQSISTLVVLEAHNLEGTSTFPEPIPPMAGIIAGAEGGAPEFIDFPSCAFPQEIVVEGQVTAVAYGQDGVLYAQSREPARLYRHEPPFGRTPEAIELGGASVQDTGHDLFHRAAGAGIACAQCHPEGGEDGHVWNFSDVGPRRTQPLFVRLEGTAPFHWGGELTDLQDLMGEVFVKRMGGIHQVDSRVDALARYVFSLTPPVAPRDADDPAVLRGKALFESLDVGCVDCHGGPNFSDNENHDVATLLSPGQTQSPSLLGVAYRAPFMHTGCAEDLMGRFDPLCGGTDHGNVGDLTDAQRADLVAYMESL